MSTHVSPSDAYGYLAAAKGAGHIHSFQRAWHRRGVVWKIEVPSTRYDHANGIEWATIVLTSREVCAFTEGLYAAERRHPATRAGAYRARWEQGHQSPHPFSGLDS